MTIQTDLQNVVKNIQKDSQILHTVVHGTETQEVSTEGGMVKTISKVLKDMKTIFQKALHEMGVEKNTLTESVSAVTESVNTIKALHEETHQHAEKAERLVAGLYGVIHYKTIFYGLRKEGAKLIAERGDGYDYASDTHVYDTSVFSTWFITLPGVTVSINSDGHLLINI